MGETRAALVERGAIVEALIERDDGALRVGTVAEAAVGPALAASGRTRLTVAGTDVLLRGAAGAPEGARIRVAIVREAIPERGNPKPPVAISAPDRPLGPAPPLADRLAAEGVAVVEPGSHGPDRLEAAGWGELLETARTGLLPFDGGLLRIVPTPAMTVIDVDGSLAPGALALAGAEAAARAIRLLGIGGSIGIDLPSAGDKAVRQGAAAAIDRLLAPPFERTAVNGFGFVQIVRPRPRASLLELIQADPPLAAALALLRAAERDRARGAVALRAAPAVAARIAARPDWLAALERRRGTAVALREDERLAISAGHVEPIAPR